MGKCKRGSFIISGDKFSFVDRPDTTYDVVVDPKSGEVGLEKRETESSLGGFGVEFIKAGKAFPVLDPETNQRVDLTDQTRDRFFVGQNAVGAEFVKEIIYYKQ